MKPIYLKAAVLGLAAGTVAGLFGVGGGIVVVPGLVLWLMLAQREASGTSIAAIEVAAATALVSFGISGNVDWTAAFVVFLGSAVGAIFGARLTTKIPERGLTALFALVVLIGGIRMLL